MTKILVVDDSISMRQMVVFTLEGAGYEVAEAADGVLALDWAKENSCDLVLTDVNMPNMDGLELVTELRRLPEYSKKPVLVLTTERSDEMKVKGKNAGATGWIVKPFVPDQLLKAVNIVLNK